MFANSHQESARCCFYRDISGFQGCSSRYGELRNFLNPEKWKSRYADRQMCWGFLFVFFTPCVWIKQLVLTLPGWRLQGKFISKCLFPGAIARTLGSSWICSPCTPGAHHLLQLNQRGTTGQHGTARGNLF